MKFTTTILIVLCTLAAQAQTAIDKTIVGFGGDISPKLIKYIIELTNKPNPKICYIPTASADSENNIKYWNNICQQNAIEPTVLKVWVSSMDNASTFEEILANMDAVIVSGGNTLNMVAIWRAQGIDTLLRNAYERGTILAGGSAGSICWFKNAVSDSRPVKLSVVDGLGLLPYSNCPHYDEAAKREFYHQLIASQTLTSGYACDEMAAVRFTNGKFTEAVTTNELNHAYYISSENGNANPQRLEMKILIDKKAIPTSAYSTLKVDKTPGEFTLPTYKQDTPLDAFVSLQHIYANGKRTKQREFTSSKLIDKLGDTTTDVDVDIKQKERILNKQIDKILIYKDSIAGVIRAYDGFYGLWYMQKENGKWVSAGEDIGGNTPLEAEITFREKAEILRRNLLSTSNF